MSDASVTAMGIIGTQDLTEELLADIMAKLSIVFPTMDLEPTRRLLESKIGLSMTAGEGLSSREHDPWVTDVKASIKWTYWDAYLKQLQSQGFTGPVLRVLDEDTDNILTECGNPGLLEPWRVQGLVMGDVQSGKTGNYCGLINKAADAGYKVIVLLTGTIEELRSQSQERMDEGFVGQDSNDLIAGIRKKVIGAGRFRELTIPNVLTSVNFDFLTANQRSLNGIPLQNLSQPVLLVMKKNMTPLKRLIEFLKAQPGMQQGSSQLDLPLLLVDDEADNASVNARKDEDPAKINSLIRELLGQFKRSTYVGYTATPFANVFINPDSNRNDLFPSNFIYSLKAPNSYIGAASMFSDEGSQRHQLIDLDDGAQYFPEKHTKDHAVDGLPPSLQDAIGTYLLSCAIRDLRDEGLKHRSMLINVSRFTDVQSKIADAVENHLYVLIGDIRQYLAADQIWARHGRLSQLHDLYERHYIGCGFSWDEIRLQLHDSVASVKVLTINQKTESENKLNYRQYKNTDKGRRVVAVGGMTLSRGLTLEGLCVSYFYRHSKAYDTLLQMARWFGYRPGYDDLCRVWMDEDAQGWFVDISEAVSELRSDLRHMYVNRLPPSRFGIRVKSHPSLLLVTAKNKMRNATDVELSASFSNTLIETTALYRGAEINDRNVEVTKDLIDRLGLPNIAGSRFEWSNVDSSAVATYLSAMSISALNQGFIPDARTGEQPLVAFIKDSGIAELSKWTVCLVQGKGAEARAFQIQAGDHVVHTPRKRQRSFEIPRFSASTTVRINKHRLGDANDERIGLSPEELSEAETRWRAHTVKDKTAGKSVPGSAYRGVRSTPLLVIHLLQPADDDSSSKRRSASMEKIGTDLLVAVSLSFPRYEETEATQVTYRVNKVYMRNLGLLDDESVDEQTD